MATNTIEKTIATFENHAEIFWLEDLNAVRVVWHDLHMSLEKFQEICTKGLEVVNKKSAKIWIADQYVSKGLFTKEIQDFIVEELKEIAIANGLEKVLTIYPENAGLSSMSTRKWTSHLKGKGELQVEEFKTMEELLKWISA